MDFRIVAHVHRQPRMEIEARDRCGARVRLSERAEFVGHAQASGFVRDFHLDDNRWFLRSARSESDQRAVECAFM